MLPRNTMHCSQCYNSIGALATSLTSEGVLDGICPVISGPGLWSPLRKPGLSILDLFLENVLLIFREIDDTWPYFWCCHIVEIKDYLTMQYALYCGALWLSGGGLLEKLEVHLVHPCTGQISTALLPAMH